MDATDIKAAFGQRVRLLRSQNGWSQEYFASCIGLDRSYVGGIERGERNVSLEKIALIAAGLGVDLAELFAFGAVPERKRQRNAGEGSR